MGAGYVGIFQNAHAAGLSYVAAFGFSVSSSDEKNETSSISHFVVWILCLFEFCQDCLAAIIGNRIGAFCSSGSKDARKALLVIALICVAALWVVDNELVLDRLLNRNKFSVSRFGKLREQQSYALAYQHWNYYRHELESGALGLWT